MDFGWTPEDQAFRGEVRSFIRKTIPPNWDEMNLDEEEEEIYAQEFARKLLPTKWRIMHWPEAYGGLGYGAWRQLIFSEEVTYHRFPGAWDGGNMVVAPLLMHAGTEDQKRRFLGPIANAEYSWCQLFTEPESGSDLASLRTRAVLTGDDYVVNGQKVFNTGAHLADWGLLACRTDTEVPKHRGISFLLVDMKSPGVTVRPLINLTGAHAQNEVFLEDVRVPKDHLVGRENEGWYLLVLALSSERGGINRATQAKRLLDDVTGFVAGTGYNGRPIGKRPEV
ncbi:MAG: acyl-CoA dehydrogenase family protein, partial [Chloroflexota bacterium]